MGRMAELHEGMLEGARNWLGFNVEAVNADGATEGVEFAESEVRAMLSTADRIALEEEATAFLSALLDSGTAEGWEALLARFEDAYNLGEYLGFTWAFGSAGVFAARDGDGLAWADDVLREHPSGAMRFDADAGTLTYIPSANY